MTDSTTVTVNFKGANITVTGQKPYMFPEHAEHVGAKVLINPEYFSSPYNSLQYLIGSASGWGMQQGKISNSVHFNAILDQSSDKVSFDAIALYLDQAEYDRLKEIISDSGYSKEDWTNDARIFLMDRYALSVPPVMMNDIADHFFNDGFRPKCFNNGFYAIESRLAETVGLDPTLLIKELYNGKTDKDFWKNFYKACENKGIKVISKLPKK